MEYNLGYSVNAQQQLLSLPNQDALIILAWLKKQAGFDPLNHGTTIETISGPAQAIRFVIGTYKIITQVTYDQVIILSITQE